MNDDANIRLIDQLRAKPAESEWFEFKRSKCSSEQIGQYLSALANSACYLYEPYGYLIFGIDDETHEVANTDYEPLNEKGAGNQDLLIWLQANLEPRIGFRQYAVDHPDGRVYVFRIPGASSQPVRFMGQSYIRVGSSKTKLSRYPEIERAIWERKRNWSAEISERATMDDLDPAAIEKAREEFKHKHPHQIAEVDEWDDITFLNKAQVLQQGAVTNTALLLLGRPESSSLLTPMVAEIIWVLKNKHNREQDYRHFTPPFILAGDGLLECIRNLTIRHYPGGTVFPRESNQYDPVVIREALHNCIAHQDYLRQGRVNVVEFPDRILFQNLGSFLPGDVETVIGQDAPQSVYRNRFLARAMVELNLIDTQGGGIKRMFSIQRERAFPLPQYDLSKPDQVTVSIAGTILNEHYTRLLMARQDIDLDRVMLLDKIQRKQPVTNDEYRLLASDGLVGGDEAQPIILDPQVFSAGETGVTVGDSVKVSAVRHERGDQHYLERIIALIEDHASADREEINTTIMPMLPESLTDKQKQGKVRNLIQKLRVTGRIINRGSRAQPRWELVDDAEPPQKNE